MKIAIPVVRFSIEKLGGVERDVIEIGREFKKKGHDVSIICRDFKKGELREEEIGGIKIFRANAIRIKWLKMISSFFGILKIIKKIDADIYNPRDWSPTFPFLFLKKHYIMTSHGFHADYEKTNPFTKFMEKFVLSKAKKPIICVQRKSPKVNYIKKFDFKIIPNGIDPKEFKVKEGHKKFVLFVGAVNERKNIKRVCEAISNLNKEGLKLKLKVAGLGPFKKELEKKHPGVDFLGHKKDEELIKLYQECKFFILPSTAEGFGRVWLEALACGKPIIASTVGEGPILVQDRDFGRIVKDVHSVREISTAIKSLNNQIDKKGVNNKKIREFVLENYTWEKIAEGYLKLFNEEIKNENFNNSGD